MRYNREGPLVSLGEHYPTCHLSKPRRGSVKFTEVARTKCFSNASILPALCSALFFLLFEIVVEPLHRFSCLAHLWALHSKAWRRLTGASACDETLLLLEIRNETATHLMTFRFRFRRFPFNYRGRALISTVSLHGLNKSAVGMM
ncbi:hypothetical protein CEXT_73151 [Caerostris extrusa]|uniref:Uncharacterized protein n=1 Tax=Caerostris extrusa TaxID=172846 RepID=A0AAV4Y507_CAEEX|nr:hypothetical protein CEXT_73151 [Caerostris extrusa]